MNGVWWVVRGQAKAVNSASCNGVWNASREQGKRVVGPPIARENKKELKNKTGKIANQPRIRRRLAVEGEDEGEDEGEADTDASPANAQTEDANED